VSALVTAVLVVRVERGQQLGVVAGCLDFVVAEVSFLAIVARRSAAARAVHRMGLGVVTLRRVAAVLLFITVIVLGGGSHIL
jgi:hypothetical protein